jgi:hypothetical protein
MLYATSTAVMPCERALDTTRDTAPLTSFPAQPLNQLATGCVAIRSINAASAGRERRHASACFLAGDCGLTKSFIADNALPGLTLSGRSAPEIPNAAPSASAAMETARPMRTVRERQS